MQGGVVNSLPPGNDDDDDNSNNLVRMMIMISVQWQPGGLTIHTKKWFLGVHTKKWFLGAAFLGAPPISLLDPGRQWEPTDLTPSPPSAAKQENNEQHNNKLMYIYIYIYTHI